MRVKLDGWRCENPKCRHEWLSPIVARQCPKCRSRKWNELDRLREMSESDSPNTKDLSEPHSLTYTSFEDW